MTRGTFITLEGGEGAGKSTQARLLAEHLRSQGREVVQTREVGGCPTAEAIRHLWLDAAEGVWDVKSELLLILAARQEHVIKVISPALKRGAIVVCDRFTDSTVAYQGWVLGLGAEFVEKVQQAIGAPKPDLTILLDVSLETSLTRMNARGGAKDRYEIMDDGMHTRLAEAFLKIKKDDPDRFLVISAEQPVEVIADKIRAQVAQRLGLP